MVVIIEKDKL